MTSLEFYDNQIESEFLSLIEQAKIQEIIKLRLPFQLINGSGSYAFGIECKSTCDELEFSEFVKISTYGWKTILLTVVSILYFVWKPKICTALSATLTSIAGAIFIAYNTRYLTQYKSLELVSTPKMSVLDYQTLICASTVRLIMVIYKSPKLVKLNILSRVSSSLLYFYLNTELRSVYDSYSRLDRVQFIFESNVFSNLMLCTYVEIEDSLQKIRQLQRYRRWVKLWRRHRLPRPTCPRPTKNLIKIIWDYLFN